MEEILPVDLVSLFLQEIELQRRPPDGLLHPSGDLIGSLRHSMLRAAGASAKQRPIAQDIRLLHGTLWHDWFHSVLEKRGVKHENEVPLTEYMPEGWSGTADWVFWSDHYEAWVLGDLKTAKGEAMFWLDRKGAKDEHIWQLSAYWHALVDSGRPMVKGFGIMYWPMNDASSEVTIQPTVIECDPIPREIIYEVMEERWAVTREYVSRVQADGDFINEALADEQPRVQKLMWNPKQGVWDVKLVPHWSAAFCDYPDYCDCSTRGQTKIGHWRFYEGDSVDYQNIGWEYRTGYDIEPEVEPTVYEVNKRR